MDKIINGKIIKEKILSEIKKEVLSKKDKLKLVVVQVGDDAASNIYIENKKKVCKETGIDFEHLKYDFISEKDLIDQINKLNNDKPVTGILVQLPLPNNLNKEKIINAIDPLKDVDGLTDINREKLSINEKTLIPCTALGVLEILKYLNVDLKDKNVAIMGRSILVGEPLAKLLKNKKANVSVCHSKTENKKEITSKADILIVAIGKTRLIDSSYVKDGAIVIDVGINRDNGKITGDCDFDDIYDKCKFITPVPGGVGQLTTAMLTYNVLEAYKFQNDK